jgi:outer membrane receptor protein involved in Fe transport
MFDEGLSSALLVLSMDNPDRYLSAKSIPTEPKESNNQEFCILSKTKNIGQYIKNIIVGFVMIVIFCVSINVSIADVITIIGDGDSSHNELDLNSISTQGNITDTIIFNLDVSLINSNISGTAVMWSDTDVEDSRGGTVYAHGVHLNFQSGSALILNDTGKEGSDCRKTTPEAACYVYSRATGFVVHPTTDQWFRHILLDASDSTLEFFDGSSLIFNNGTYASSDGLKTDTFLMSAHIGNLILNSGSLMQIDIPALINLDPKLIENKPGFNTGNTYRGLADGGGIMIDNLTVRSGSSVTIGQVGVPAMYILPGTNHPDEFILDRHISTNLVYDITDNSKTIAITGTNLTGYESTIFVIRDGVDYVDPAFRDNPLVTLQFDASSPQAGMGLFASRLLDPLRTIISETGHPESIWKVVDSDGIETSWSLNFNPGDYFTIVECLPCAGSAGPIAAEFHYKTTTVKNDFEVIDFMLTTFDPDTFDDLGNPTSSSRSTPYLRYVYYGDHYVTPGREETYLESRIAGLVFLSQGAELLSGTLPAQTRQRNSPDGSSVMFATRGYDISVRTGSSVGFQGMSFLLGPAWHRRTPWGSLTVGGAVEGGRGKYTTHNPYTDRAEVIGDGKVDYLGAALFAGHEFDAGYHAELSLRLGRLRNEFNATGQAQGTSDRLRDASFDTTSTYFGGHAGLGYAFDYRPNLVMDVYGQAYWTHVGPAHTAGAVSGKLIRFDASDTVNLRAGVRYTYTGLEGLSIYAGAAYDRGVSGNKVDGQAYGQQIGRLGQPSSEGGSGIFEGGVTWRPSPGSGFTLDLSGRAYTGQVFGGSGNLSLKWEFDADGTFVPGPSGGRQDTHPVLGTGPAFPPAAGQGSAPSGSWDGSSGADVSNQETAVPPSWVQVRDSGRSVGGTSQGGNDLPQITVQAERPEWERTLSPGTVTVVEPDDFSGEQKTVADMLEKVPGMFIRRVNGTGQYTTASIRGSTGAQVAVYIDGVPQKRGGDAAVDLSTIPVLNVARIEVYRGYVPVRFDGAPIGGVINIVTKRPEEASTRVLFGKRSLNGYNAELTFTSSLGNGSLLVGAAHDRSDGDFKYRHPGNGTNGYLEYYQPRYRWRMSNGFSKTDLMAKWQDDNWFVSVAWKDYLVQLPQSIIPQGNGTVDVPKEIIPFYNNIYPGEHKEQRTLQRDISLGRRQTWGNLDWGIRFDYSIQDKRFRYIEGEQIYNSHHMYAGLWSNYDSERWGTSLDVSYKLGSRNLIEFHGDYSEETLHVDVSDKYGTGYGYNQPVLDRYSQKMWHLQLQDTITLNESGDFWLTVVVRYDMMQGDTARGKDNDGDMGWVSTWGAALKKDFGDTLTLRASYGTFNRFPNFYEMFGDGGYIYPSVIEANSEDRVGREHGRQWDVGVDLRGELYGIKIRATANYFNRLVHDAIMLIARRQVAKYVNNQSIKFKGIEFETHIEVGHLAVDVAATRQTFKSAGQNRNRMYPFYVQLPENMVNARVSYGLFDDKITIFTEYNHTGKIDYLTDINENHPVYMEQLNIINAGIKWSVSDSLQISFGGNDLTNEGPKQRIYDTGTDFCGSNGCTYDHAIVPFPQQGRTWYSTVEIKF